MDRQIRRLGIALVALFALLFGQVAYVQVFAAERIADSPGNATRQIRAEFEVERGQIIAADRRTVLARSVEAGPNQVFRYRREYPEGELFGHITGYYSRIFGRAGIEQAFNDYLAGTASELAVSNVTDLILGRPKKGASVYTTIQPTCSEPRSRPSATSPAPSRRSTRRTATFSPCTRAPGSIRTSCPTARTRRCGPRGRS